MFNVDRVIRLPKHPISPVSMEASGLRSTSRREECPSLRLEWLRASVATANNVDGSTNIELPMGRSGCWMSFGMLDDQPKQEIGYPSLTTIFGAAGANVWFPTPLHAISKLW